ncbi:MAG: alpha/beta family hydrolase [Marmoricola sp.]
MPSPGLTRTTPVFSPRGIVLMLHGGAKTGLKPVGSRSASFRRTSTMRDVLEPRILGHGLSLWLLRFSVRGWNADASEDPSPVVDARWAIDQAASAHPDLPVILLGHSMGARTAVHVADHDQVAGVVGLAPWLEPGDPVDTLSKKHLIVGHGSRDKITSASATRAYVDRAAGVAASAQFEDMGRLGHYMLHRPQEWNAFALRSTVEILKRTLTDDDQLGDRTASRPVG